MMSNPSMNSDIILNTRHDSIFFGLQTRSGRSEGIVRPPSWTTRASFSTVSSCAACCIGGTGGRVKSSFIFLYCNRVQPRQISEPEAEKRGKHDNGEDEGIARNSGKEVFAFLTNVCYTHLVKLYHY